MLAGRAPAGAVTASCDAGGARGQHHGSGESAEMPTKMGTGGDFECFAAADTAGVDGGSPPGHR